MLSSKKGNPTSTSSIASPNPWLLAARPKTLTAAFAPVLVGTAVSAALLGAQGQKVSWLYSVFALLSALFIQKGTNFINDALDFKKGADTETRLGPQRVTQSSLLTPTQVLAGGLICFFIACLFGVPLVWHGGAPILILGLLSLLCGYLYTGGPYPLAYVGLGELFVLLFFGLGAVGGVTYLQMQTVPLPALVAGAQVGSLASVLISINNYRDHEGDKKVGKLTLAARFGASFARAEIIFFMLVPFFLNAYWIQQGFLKAGLLPFLTLPLVFKIAHGVLKLAPSIALNRYLGFSALLQILFSTLLSIGFFVH